jgi:hypothetical protein
MVLQSILAKAILDAIDATGFSLVFLNISSDEPQN